MVVHYLIAIIGVVVLMLSWVGVQYLTGNITDDAAIGGCSCGQGRKMCGVTKKCEAKPSNPTS